ncbi:MAG: GH3 auxin-responsive promoter family protein [Chloroflexi bacterium]|nr:GH3 auxin-responsive promoter family protein [Chloroflexota bacterium]
METAMQIWKSGDRNKIWQYFCGFLDLDMDRFLDIQNQKLLAQLELLNRCDMGRKLLGNPLPTTVNEFRDKVPLTTYGDYTEWFAERKEGALPARPCLWACTSGTSGTLKWVPLTETMLQLSIETAVTTILLSTAVSNGEFTLKYSSRIFGFPPPTPYIAWSMMGGLVERFGFRFIPPLDEEYARSDMMARMSRGFTMAMREGVDVCVGIPAAVIRVAEGLGQRKRAFSLSMLDPRILRRILGAVRKAKRANRAMLPKDFWDLKSMVLGGQDLDAFREKIKAYWGVDAYEYYVNSEFTGCLGLPAWNHKGMTFFPHIGFLEFIREEDSRRLLSDPGYRPSTLLLNELCSGESYEVVFTNFNGGAFTRYRPGDMIKVISLGDPDTGVSLPQFRVRGRADKLIDIAGFTRIDESTIWRAVEQAGVHYEGWIARKETEAGQPVLRLYLALNQEVEVEALQDSIHHNLKLLDSSYRDVETILGLRPLRIKLLPWGTFDRWEKERIAAGADPAFIKEQHMQPNLEIMNQILVLAGEPQRSQD